MRTHPGRAGSAVVVAAVLTLGACTGTSADRRAATGPASPSAGGRGGGAAAAPVSPEEYRTTVNGVLDPLDSALRRLRTAKGYNGLGKVVTGVEEAVKGAVTRLQQTTPPADASTEQANLVTALRGFQSGTAALNLDVDDREYCTGSAVRARLGRRDDTPAVRDALGALAAKIPGVRRTLSLPDGRQHADRPANGHFVRSGGRSGRGTLTIDNGGSADAVIKATRGGDPAFSIYVRRGRKFTVSGVRDGTYRLFFTSGAEWDPGARAFGRDCSFQRFDDPLAFKTTYTSTQVRWSTWRISLQPVAGGTASTSDVAPDDFPGG